MPPPRREHGRHAVRANASSATVHGHSGAHGPSRGKVAVPKPVILPSMRADTGASVDVVVASAFSTSARTWGNAGGSGSSVRGVNAGASSARDGNGGDGGAEEVSLASVGATWGRRETTTTAATSEIRDDRVTVVRRGEYPSLRGDASGGDERPARTVASDVERAARQYADEHRGYEHRAEEDERYVGPAPDTADERDVDARGGRRHGARGDARGFGGGRGRDRRGATAPTRILTRRERDDDETSRSSAGEIPGMTSPSTTHAVMPTSPVASRAREVDPKTEEERAAFDKELDAVAEEIARRRHGGEPDASERSPTARAHSENNALTIETTATTTAPRHHAPLRQDTFDPYAAPNISASALLREPIVPATQKSVERDEHVVDRPGSEFLRAHGGVKSPPMVLRRPTPPPATRAVPERDAGTEASSSDDGGGGGGGGGGDKARKRRGGRRVREREERRALRTTKDGKVATYDDDGMAAALAPDGGWGGQTYAGYSAANVPVTGAYVHAFADSARLFTTFAPPTYHGYVPGGYAQYGYSPQAAPPMWQPDASLTQYARSAPVPYPVDTPYSATGTYGDDANAVAMPSDVERLSTRLNDLPASLGAEFGSTDELTSFAQNKDAAHATAPVRRRGSRGGTRGRAVAANGQGGAQQ